MSVIKKLIIERNVCFYLKVKQGDVVDVVLKGKHPDKDRELPSAAVMRVKVLRIREELTSKDRVPVKLRRWKHLEV